MKPRKPLWEISVDTTPEAEDAVSELMSRFFRCAASCYSDWETGRSRVTVFVRKKISQGGREKLREGLKHIEHYGLKTGASKILVAKVRREDWEESWKRHFKPLEISRSLLIKPAWSKKHPRKNQAVIVLNPGMSFGTGQHPTTEFCLREIARHANRKTAGAERGDGRHQKGRLSFLDIGTGSGILAIAAAKLGYKRVCAFDCDPDAVRAARANARANGVLRKIQIYNGDATRMSLKTGQRFDLICANLISNPLITERKRVAARLRQGGTLVLAGILKPEFPDVRRAYEKSGMKLVLSKSKNEWRSGTFKFCQFNRNRPPRLA